MRRFWSKVNKEGRCWVWTAHVDRCGYGVINIGGKNKRAHRVSWELAFGKIPRGKIICHKCDFPPCVKLDHLFLGTQSENMVDAFKKNRKDYSGSKNMRAILKETDVRRIRLLPSPNIASLAREYGVHRQTIWAVVKNVNWAGV